MDLGRLIPGYWTQPVKTSVTWDYTLRALMMSISELKFYFYDNISILSIGTYRIYVGNDKDKFARQNGTGPLPKVKTRQVLRSLVADQLIPIWLIHLRDEAKKKQQEQRRKQGTSKQAKTKSPSWTRILKVPKTATKAEVRKAANDLLKKHHPDKGGDVSMAQKINNAKADAYKYIERNSK